MRAFVSQVVLLFFLLPVHGQYYPLRDFEYTWKETNPTSIPVHARWENHPAVILKDERRLSVRGQKSTHMYVYLERKMRVKLHSRDGERVPFQTFRLPESWDPFYDARNLPLEKRDERLSADYLNVRMVFFAARKILPGGGTVSVDWTDRFDTDRLEIYQRSEVQFRYVFDLLGLAPNDEIEIHFKVEVPYIDNPMLFNYQRIFFHHSYPIQEQRLEVVMPKHNISLITGVKPDSVYTRKRRTSRVWHRHNLSPCVNEPGIRPSLDLPHIVVSLNTQSFRNRTRHYLSDQLLPSDYTYKTLLNRESNAFWLYRVATRRIELDAQTKKLKRFIAGHTSDIPDDLNLAKFARLHEVITEDFSFSWDDAYYEERDMSLEKMGSQVERGQMRDISRYNLYAKMINMLGLSYNTAYMMDSRIGTMTIPYHGNVLFSDFSFAIPDDQNMLNFFYPKRNRFGYGPNEFPFYLAGTPAFLVNYVDLHFEDGYFPPLVNLPEMTDENFRQTRLHMEIDTKNRRASGTLDVSLSGQFSTLTRSLFEFGRIDSTINPAYSRIVLDGHDVEWSNLDRTEYNHFAPFGRRYEVDFNWVDAGQALGGNAYELPLSNWFNFVTWRDFDRFPRVLPFYPDFVGWDEFVVHLSFDQPVEILNLDELERTVENDFGEFAVQFTKEHPNEISIRAYHSVIAEQVPANQAVLVSQIYGYIQDLNNASLKLGFFQD